MKYEIVRINLGRLDEDGKQSKDCFAIRKRFLFFWYKYLELFTAHNFGPVWAFLKGGDNNFKEYCLSYDKDFVLSKYNLLIRNKGRITIEPITDLEKLVSQR